MEGERGKEEKEGKWRWQKGMKENGRRGRAREKRERGRGKSERGKWRGGKEWKNK